VYAREMKTSDSWQCILSSNSVRVNRQARTSLAIMCHHNYICHKRHSSRAVLQNCWARFRLWG